jgi:hypothetical protein
MKRQEYLDALVAEINDKLAEAIAEAKEEGARYAYVSLSRDEHILDVTAYENGTMEVGIWDMDKEYPNVTDYFSSNVLCWFDVDARCDYTEHELYEERRSICLSQGLYY